MSTELDRKEIKKPDVFLEHSTTFIHFLNQNIKLVVALFVFALLGAGGFTLYLNLKKNKEQNAYEALYNAQKSLQANLLKSPLEWEKNLKLDIEKLEALSKNYSKTAATFEAYVNLGNLYFDKGNTLKASEYFNLATQSTSHVFLKNSARFLLATAFENSKKYGEAILNLELILQSGEKSLRQNTLLALARNYELKGDKEKAKTEYDRIQKEYPNTSGSKFAEFQKRYAL